MRIKKGDQVKVIAGKDRGKIGTVLKIHTSDERATIEGVNLQKKRSRPRQQGQKGETVMVPRPVRLSNIMRVCASCKSASRTGVRVDEAAGIRIRYCKKCGAAA